MGALASLITRGDSFAKFCRKNTRSCWIYISHTINPSIFNLTTTNWQTYIFRYHDEKWGKKSAVNIDATSSIDSRHFATRESKIFQKTICPSM